jgi:hypothetical protein
VALNRTEQLIADYLQTQPEEKSYWMGKVQKLSTSQPDPHAAAGRLEAELWQYYRERSEIVPVFRDLAQREGTARTSMRNLAEYLLRLWGAPRPKRPPPPAEMF